jgi:hypothetical protein
MADGRGPDQPHSLKRVCTCNVWLALASRVHACDLTSYLSFTTTEQRRPFTSSALVPETNILLPP